MGRELSQARATLYHALVTPEMRETPFPGSSCLPHPQEKEAEHT